MLGSLLPQLVLSGAVVLSWQKRDQWPSLDPPSDLVDEVDSKSQCSWTCLKFTLQWPGSFCLSLDEMSCRIPPDINTWTIHGLWPQGTGNCCRCWNLFPSDLQDLHEELSEQWPSLLSTTSSFHFWKLEWMKHGACAACVEGFNSPEKYFSLCLKLRQLYDITRALSEGGVVPSCDRPYKLAELQQVLTPLIGQQHEIQCIADPQGREYWYQVKIPLSRNLTRGCSDHHNLQDPTVERGSGLYTPRHRCPEQALIYLVPIDHENPLHPCG